MLMAIAFSSKLWIPNLTVWLRHLEEAKQRPKMEKTIEHS